VEAVEWSVEAYLDWQAASDYWHYLEGTYDCRSWKIFDAEDETIDRHKDYMNATRRLQAVAAEIRRVAGDAGVQLIDHVRRQHTDIVRSRRANGY